MKLYNKLDSCIKRLVNLLFFIQFQFFHPDSCLFFAFVALKSHFFSIEFQKLQVSHLK
jgi:hypothetical protein